jgi:hypothetical protein
MAKHGSDCLDSRLTDEIEWEVFVCALHERGFLTPGPTVDHVSYWLITDHWREHDLAGLTVVQMMCGGWTYLANERMFGGALGMPTLLNRWERISKTVVGIRILRLGALRAEPKPARLTMRFRYASTPQWRAPTRRFRLVREASR